MIDELETRYRDFEDGNMKHIRSLKLYNGFVARFSSEKKKIEII